MRLSKRAYRCRKERVLNTERARTEHISKSLDAALAIFARLHEQILASCQAQSPSHVLIHLNETAAHMTAIAHNANRVVRFSDPPEAACPRTRQQDLASWPLSTAAAQDEWTTSLGPTVESKTPTSKAVSLTLQTNSLSPSPISERIFRACWERVIPLLSSGVMSGSWSPALALPLQFLGEKMLLMQTYNDVFLHLTIFDFQYVPNSAAHLPPMFRVVEGGNQVLPRLPSPNVQRIVRGRTRTTLMTDSGAFQGEWLEAMDVEEYLEERGIFVRDTMPAGAVCHHMNVSQMSTEQIGSIHDGRTLEGITDPDPPVQCELTSEESQPTPIETSRGFASALSSHEPADYSIFGLLHPQEWSGSVDSHMAVGTGVVPVLSPNMPWADHLFEGLRPASHIIINLDRLINLLAANATCIGPVPGIRKDAVDSSIRQSLVSV
ncbi:hypothetical protein QSH57_004471 [Fusarium oxysporum f. sp. vasinfectum]|nr:hypothetical protein QSH57_004471 [Fusarium oxysporum f. sp. vasinfectum]